MPSKSRWKLNPRKWFGAIVNAANKRNRDNASNINNFIISLPSSTTIPHLLATRSKTKVAPIPATNDNNSTNALPTVTQLQLAVFSKRREKTSTALPSTILFNRRNTLVPTRLDPSIRKTGQLNEPLSIEAARFNTQTKDQDKSIAFLLPALSQQNSAEKQSEINASIVSNQCLISYPQNLPNQFSKKCSLSMRTRSTSSIADNEDNDELSSSGIFSEERTDSNNHHHIASKERLSTTEVLSVESVDASQTSLDQSHSRTSIQPYRLSVSTFEATNNNLEHQQSQSSTIHFQRARSAEDILNNNQINRPATTKSRQSVAAIVKKIEKRVPTNRQPTATLEKASFVRIANDTYRLTTDKDDHLYRRQRSNPMIQYSTNDESLPPANNEECYAQLPRTSSTEQLDNNLQNDLRAIVNDCLRPIAASIDKPTYRSIKNHHRSKRPHTKHEHTQIIENITDKLLSSMDCSIYAQYQRCC
jgi:hypothetical protein